MRDDGLNGSGSTPDRLELVRAAVNSSPFYLHLGMRVESCGEGRSLLVMEARESATNIYGSLHGGSLASLIDSACGLALASRLEPTETAVTVDLNIKYLRPAFPGRLSATGQVIYRGKVIGVEEAEIHQENGELLAKGTAVHVISRRAS